MSWANPQDWFGLENFLEDYYKELYPEWADKLVHKNGIPYVDNIPYWKTADHKLIAIKDMETSHIKSCMQRIYRFNKIKRHRYLKLFKAELQKREESEHT